MNFQHLFLEQEVDSVPDNQCYKLNENFCVQCLITLATHSPVSKIQLCALMFTKEKCHPVNLFLYILTFGCLLPFVIANVEVALPFIGRIQLVLHRDAVHFVITQAIFAFFFKTAFHRLGKIPHQRLHALHHDNELITVLIHKMDTSSNIIK